MESESKKVSHSKRQFARLTIRPLIGKMAIINNLKDPFKPSIKLDFFSYSPY